MNQFNFTSEAIGQAFKQGATFSGKQHVKEMDWKDSPTITAMFKNTNDEIIGQSKNQDTQETGGVAGIMSSLTGGSS